MHSRFTPTRIALLLAVLSSAAAHAGLYDVDRGQNGQYLASHGYFAKWYQDTHGRNLELCLSKAVSKRVGSLPSAPSYMCLLPAAEENGFDPAKPIAFPGNFPDEAFWFVGDAAIADAEKGIDLRYVSAVEAAFSAGTAKDGEQVSFARIRIRADLPCAGTYTVTHPYGVEVFTVSEADFVASGGKNAINMTRDMGIGAPKDYTGALGGDIGPFLRSRNGPYTEVNPDTGATETFIGDPNIPEPVTGSPFDTNYLRIEGPNGIDIRTDLFSVSGKLSSDARPTPVQIKRATYSRSPGDSGSIRAQQDVFALAPPPPGTSTLVDDSNNSTAMSEADGTGAWYGQSQANPAPSAEARVTADNQAGVPGSTPTTTSTPMVDLVSITRAEYSQSTGNLTVQASSSDQTERPALTVVAARSGTVIGTLSGDGETRTLTTKVTPIPPGSVRVISANGGSDTETVDIVP
ncbi:hypothetical protein D3C78_387230 [compost metagenome]